MLTAPKKQHLKSLRKTIKFNGTKFNQRWFSVLFIGIIPCSHLTIDGDTGYSYPSSYKLQEADLTWQSTFPCLHEQSIDAVVDNRSNKTAIKVGNVNLVSIAFIATKEWTGWISIRMASPMETHRCKVFVIWPSVIWILLFLKCRSIALKMLYIWTFGSKMIGRSVRPQIKEKWVVRLTPSIGDYWFSTVYSLTVRPNE